MPSKNSDSVLIVAGEASSALYAQRLLELWKFQKQNIAAFGVGSLAMEELGFEVLGRSEEMAVVGLQEILAHYSDIKACFDKLVVEAERRRPKFALLLDYPEFNLKLAKKLKKLNIPVIYYISPQIWAWRKGRIHKIKSLVAKMLVLFPFEKPFYENYQVPVEFVGHPLMDEINDKYFDEQYLQDRRNRYGIIKGERVLGLMPGSRQSEIKHHLSTQIEVARKVIAKNPNVKIALLVAPTLDLEKIKADLPEYDFPLMIIKDDPFNMIHICDQILCASGTATILVGLMRKPMVIMYRMNSVSAFLAKIFVRSTKYFGMINLIHEKLVVPELFQEKASIEELFTEVDDIMYNEERRQKMVTELSETQNKLGAKGATARVAESLKEFL